MVVTKDAAWFTDSVEPTSSTGCRSGPEERSGPRPSWLFKDPLPSLGFDFNLNGIAATPNGKTLIVSHSGLGALFTVDPETGESSLIEGVSVPAVDGILLEAGRLYAVQNILNQIAEIKLELRPLLRIGRGPHHQPEFSGADHGGPRTAISWQWSTPSSTRVSRPPPTPMRW